MKSKSIFLFVLFAIATNIMAQNANSSERLRVFKVSGTLTDAADQSPIVGASVAIYNDTTLLAGTTSDTHGKFALEVGAGEYIMECSFIGYETIRMSLSITANTNLGSIEMYEAAQELGEVVVESQGVINKVDRQILLPNESQTIASHDGITLLQNMQLPRLTVSPIDNTIKTTAGDAVQLRINGVEVTSAEVQAINPKDVIRIEYHDNPSVRYGDAKAVINYIVRQRDTGGSLMLNAMDAVTPLLGWGGYFASGKVHFGKSSLSLLANYNPRDINWTRTNEETYRFPDGTLENTEIGEPTKFKAHPLDLALTYNWTNADKQMLNIKIGDAMLWMPNSKTDRDSRLFQQTDSFAIHDHESSRTQSPSVDIYFQQQLPQNQALYFNLVGTYIYSNTDRRFTQTPLGETASLNGVPEKSNLIVDRRLRRTDVLSAVRGNKYSLIGEAIYEKEWENIALTAGVRHNQQWMNNTYRSYDYTMPDSATSTLVNMRTAETYLFGEVQQKVGQFSYAAGIGVMRTHIVQSGQQQTTWIPRPTLTLAYDFGKGVFLRYHAEMSGYQPSLSAISDVTQQIDRYQLRRGNPNLHSVWYASNDINLSWQSKHVTLDLNARYSYDHQPIMEESYIENEMVVRSQANQRGFHRLQVTPTIQVRLLSNQLIMSATPFMNYYVSAGNNYEHRYFNPGVRASIMGRYKQWNFFGEMHTRYNNLWGETIEYGEFTWNIGAGYNEEHWGLRLMVLNLFSSGYNIKTVNLSAVAPYTQHAEMRDFKSMVILSFHCNLDWGKSASEHGKRLNNEDKDSGILSGAK